MHHLRKSRCNGVHTCSLIQLRLLYHCLYQTEMQFGTTIEIQSHTQTLEVRNVSRADLPDVSWPCIVKCAEGERRPQEKNGKLGTCAPSVGSTLVDMLCFSCNRGPGPAPPRRPARLAFFFVWLATRCRPAFFFSVFVGWMCSPPGPVFRVMYKQQ